LFHKVHVFSFDFVAVYPVVAPRSRLSKFKRVFLKMQKYLLNRWTDFNEICSVCSS